MGYLFFGDFMQAQEPFTQSLLMTSWYDNKFRIKNVYMNEILVDREMPAAIRLSIIERNNKKRA